MIVKPVSRLIQELDATSFTVVGCPGADGLGAESLQIFAQALAEAEGDFIVVLGDAVPLGRDPYYRTIAGFIDSVAAKPVYVMRGSRDGPDYGEYFGCGQCAVIAEDFTLIMLDNPDRRFPDETLAFLRDTLAIVESHYIVVAFHIPPPNRFCGDSLPQAEWNRFEEAVGVWRKRISLMICGHAQSYFEDEVDGLRLIVTGGGGFRIRRLDRVAGPPSHALECRIGADGDFQTRMRRLAPAAPAGRDPKIRARLERAFADECRAQVCNQLDAAAAQGRGHANLARLYRAAAESGLQHARILRRIIAGERDPLAGGAGCPGSGGEEPADADLARDVMAAETLRRVTRADKALAALLDEALAETSGGGDAAETGLHVCHSCGLIFTGRESPNYCAQCGAPADKIHEVQ